MPQVRPVRPGDERRISELFEIVFDTPLSLDAWRWKYGRGGVACVAEEDGEILCHVGALWQEVAWRGAAYPSYSVGDVMSDPRARRRGLFAETIVEVFGRHVDGRVLLVFGFPGEAARHLYERAVGAEPVAPVHKLTKAISTPLPKLPAEIEIMTEPSADWDAHWERLEARHGLVVRRTRERLRWRYVERPDRRYRFVGVPGRPFLAVVDDGAPVARVMDFLADPSDPLECGRLLLALEVAAAGAGATELLAWFPAPSWEARFFAGPGGFAGADADHHFECARRDPRLPIDWLAEHFFYSLGDWDVH